MMGDRGWRTNPGIQAAKAACQATNSTAVILIAINDNNGTVQYSSYGIDGRRCDEAGALLDQIAEFVRDGS